MLLLVGCVRQLISLRALCQPWIIFHCAGNQLRTNPIEAASFSWSIWELRPHDPNQFWLVRFRRILGSCGLSRQSPNFSSLRLAAALKLTSALSISLWRNIGMASFGESTTQIVNWNSISPLDILDNRRRVARGSDAFASGPRIGIKAVEMPFRNSDCILVYIILYSPNAKRQQHIA